MKKTAFVMITVIILASCQTPDSNRGKVPAGPINELAARKTIEQLILKVGDEEKYRIEKGVRQVAVLWRNSDGNINDFEKFCLDHFIKKGPELETMFNKLSVNFETIMGFFNRMSLDLKKPLHLDMGEVTLIDELFGGWEPSSHLNDDLYANKVAFMVALNFPSYNLKEKTELGKSWNRLDWAYARMGDAFTSRVPAEIILNASEVLTSADNYISSYNIYAGYLVDEQGKTYFPKDMVLLSHWNLRDELKSQYGQDDGLGKQKMIYEVMKRIITQEIPAPVINDTVYTWNPFSNKIFKNNLEESFVPEDNIRYLTLLKNFHAMKQVDPFTPQYPTYIQRKFEQEYEIPQQEVEKLFIEFVSSDQVKKVAAIISKRLGRNLEPFDIWYDGFKGRSGIPENELTTLTSKKYPTPADFEKDMPNMLLKLGFEPAKANFISSKIAVDGARGSGHAWGASMKEQKSHLRTRANKNGMDYKGYNIAIHELGHNVEQTITLHDVDYFALAGVPNTAFTEATAFIFQKRDLELLGIANDNSEKEYLLALDNFWSCYEIMGVSLVDMNVWKWLYENPDATPEELKQAVLRISKEIWNKYYADVFGVKDQVILAIYSHMIDNPLYLSAYPIGHIIEFQVEKQLKGKNFASEILRMYTYGRVIPQAWMQNAVGSSLSITPILEAVDEALLKIK